MDPGQFSDPKYLKNITKYYLIDIFHNLKILKVCHFRCKEVCKAYVCF